MSSPSQSHLFNKPQALEFFKLYPDTLDSLYGPSRKEAWSKMIHSLKPLIRLMLRDPALIINPEAEGQRVGALLWDHGVLEVARKRHQTHYTRTFTYFAKAAEKAGRWGHARFYRAVGEQLVDPDQEEWHLVGDNDFK